jgi:hypothetical protein
MILDSGIYLGEHGGHVIGIIVAAAYAVFAATGVIGAAAVANKAKDGQPDKCLGRQIDIRPAQASLNYSGCK